MLTALLSGAVLARRRATRASRAPVSPKSTALAITLPRFAGNLPA
jgi:hypothetical protein